MINLWLVVYYLNKYNQEYNKSSHEWFSPKIATRLHFEMYLIHKHFQQDVRDIFERIFFPFRHRTANDEVHMERSKKQLQRISDSIDSAIGRNLITSTPSEVSGIKSDNYLGCKHNGREFLQPLRFLNAVLNEYGYIVSFVLGGGITLIVWLVASVF